MQLDPELNAWLNLILRWVHIFSAIMWVGTTYYFTWLDARLHEEEATGGDEKAQVWMVHSGGFYVVEREKRPGTRTLHWFRWEAAITWLSGFLLLVLMAYLGGGTGIVDVDVLDISGTTAIAVGVGTLIVGWIVYDLLVQSPLGRNELLFAAIAYALVVGAAYGLTHVLSGRWAYLHMGAMFGTIMAANVWMRILPAQRKMIAAAKKMLVIIKKCPKCSRTYSDEAISFCLADGALLSASDDSQSTSQIAAPRSTHEAPTEILPQGLMPDNQAISTQSDTPEETFDASLAARAKLRSKHNTFIVVPTVFLMISNHYANTYGSKYNWIILSVLILAGWGAAKIIRRA